MNREHIRDKSLGETRFDKLIDEHIINRVRVILEDPKLSWEEMLKTATVTVDTYLNVENRRKIWIRIGEKKVLHIEIKKDKLIVREI